MQNKVTVTIADREYTLVATEDAAYMEKVAKYVDQKMREIMENGISGTDAAVLDQRLSGGSKGPGRPAFRSQAGDLQAPDPGEEVRCWSC